MEREIETVLRMFAAEAQKIEGRKQGTSLKLELSYAPPPTWNADKPPELKLRAHFYNGHEHESATAASLGALLDEVYRRCQIADKESEKMEQLAQSLVALPGPADAY